MSSSLWERAAKRPKQGSFFSMGLQTYEIPMSLYADNRKRIVEAMQVSGEAGVALFKGGVATERYDSDHENLFRQESFFAYAFGVTEPGYYGAIDLNNGHSTLFIPRLAEEYAIWMGRIHPPSYFQKKYDVDEVFYVDEMAAKINAYEVVHMLHGQNTDSQSWCEEFEVEGLTARVEKGKLHTATMECRVCKSTAEIDVLRYVARISSEAHVKCMQIIKPGMAEYQIEACFQHYCYSIGGMRNMAYTCICATGPNSAVLHYGHAGAPNNRIFGDGDIALMDMGAEYNCYCSDITCSYPVNGKFTADQRVVYSAVLAAQEAVFAAIRPGVEWVAMHRLAERSILEVLLREGFLVGATVEELMDHGIGSVFMPHGLGHLLGLETHDVGGYPAGRERVPGKLGVSKLRMNRTLEEGMVLTVEPGCYFVETLLTKAMADPTTSGFFNAEAITRCISFGGVRLEDDIVVTADGMENMTMCPKQIEDVEAVMAGKEWPPPVHVA